MLPARAATRRSACFLFIVLSVGDRHVAILERYWRPSAIARVRRGCTWYSRKAMTTWKPGKFAGATRSLRLAGALMSEVLHVRGARVAPHAHEAPYFSLLLEGSYTEGAEDFTVRYEPYTVVFHDALTEHWDAIEDGGCRMFFVELLTPWTDVIAAAQKRAHLFEMDGSAPVWLVLRLHREFLAGNAASSLTIESVLFELCEYLSHPTPDASREPPWIEQVEAVLRADFAARVDLRSLAAQVAVDPSHLCKSFRRFRRRTIGDYVMGLRVRLVCRQLIETSEPLTAIAAQAGFTDQSHMTRFFKRFTGISPAAYRRQQIREPIAT
jgi:AraC family transcriptional regulator